MPRNPAPTPVVPSWTPEELLRVKGLGPALIGKAMAEAAMVYVETTKSGVFGPSLLATPEA